MSEQQPLYKYLGKPKPDYNDMFGVELELEAKPGYSMPLISNSMIQSKNDNSLRNGIEYMWNGPQDWDKTKKSIKYLTEKLGEIKNTLQFSPRCSIHVHVNVQDLTSSQLLNFIAVAWYMEDFIIDSCADYRRNNNFCARISDSETNVFNIVQGLRDGTKLFDYRFSTDRYKYSGTNLCTIRSFGTLEFRMFQATIDPIMLEAWCKTLDNMKQYAKSFDTPESLMRELEKNSFETIASPLVSDPKLFAPIDIYNAEMNNLFLISKIISAYDEKTNGYVSRIRKKRTNYTAGTTMGIVADDDLRALLMQAREGREPE